MNWWFLEQFIPWTQEKGYKIQKDDYRWIIAKIWNFSEEEQRILMRQYLYEWKLGFSNEEKSHKKDNKARFRANNFLRETLDKKNEDYKSSNSFS